MPTIMGCRNCGAPLPDQPTGACPNCGTLYGERAELEEYAAAIVSGRPAERPKSIATRRLKVRFDHGASSDYQSVGSDGSLVVTLRYFNWRSLIGLFLGLLGLAGLAFIWYLAISARVYAIATVASVLLGFYVWVRITLLFDGLLVRLAGSKLFCRQSRFWPRIETTLETADIVQLFTAQTGRTFSLYARLKDGKAAPLVRGVVNAELCVYLERQLEIALGVADQPVQGELRRDAALPNPAPRRIRGYAVELAVIGVLVTAPFFGIHACGTWVGEFEIGDQPHEINFELKDSARVFFTSDIDLDHGRWRYPDEIPKVLRFDIEIRQGARSVSRLSCDPFAVLSWTSSAHNRRLNTFWGPISGCAIKLAPGRYTLRAVRRWKPGAPRIAFDACVLGLRRD